LRRTLALFILAFACAAPSFAQTLRKPEDYLARAAARQQSGDTAGALSDIESALKLHPNYSAAYFMRGIIKKKTGDTDGALEDFSRAVKANPKEPLAHYNLGLVRLEQKNYDGAIADFDRALALDKDLKSWLERSIQYAKYQREKKKEK
jgi:Tfp pilus assembly protein PilF